MLNVALSTSEEIVQAKHIRIAREQMLTEMRPEKPRTSRHQDALLKMHYWPRLFRRIKSKRLQLKQIRGLIPTLSNPRMPSQRAFNRPKDTATTLSRSA